MDLYVGPELIHSCCRRFFNNGFVIAVVLGFIMRNTDKAESAHRSEGRGWTRHVIGPAFLLLAAWFLWGPELEPLPETRGMAVHGDVLSTTPRRQMLSDPPTIFIDGFERTCMDCHIIFPPREDPPARLLRHDHVALDHGINDRCRNCHDVNDRDRLVLRSGRSIPYSQVVELCASCHGPTYRDWQRGMHGRTDGYWNVELGPQHRLSCSECHDPHNPRVPAMDPLEPLPSPLTLRMSHARHAEPAHAGDALQDEADPLRQALLRGGGTAEHASPAHADPPEKAADQEDHGGDTEEDSR